MAEGNTKESRYPVAFTLLRSKRYLDPASLTFLTVVAVGKVHCLSATDLSKCHLSRHCGLWVGEETTCSTAVPRRPPEYWSEDHDGTRPTTRGFNPWFIKTKYGVHIMVHGGRIWGSLQGSWKQNRFTSGFTRAKYGVHFRVYESKICGSLHGSWKNMGFTLGFTWALLQGLRAKYGVHPQGSPNQNMGLTRAKFGVHSRVHHNRILGSSPGFTKAKIWGSLPGSQKQDNIKFSVW